MRQIGVADIICFPLSFVLISQLPINLQLSCRTCIYVSLGKKLRVHAFIYNNINLNFFLLFCKFIPLYFFIVKFAAHELLLLMSLTKLFEIAVKRILIMKHHDKKLHFMINSFIETLL